MSAHEITGAQFNRWSIAWVDSCQLKPKYFPACQHIILLATAARWNLWAVEVMDRKLLRRNWGETFPCFHPKCVETRRGVGTKRPHWLSCCVFEVWLGRIVMFIFLNLQICFFTVAESRCCETSLAQTLMEEYETFGLWYKIECAL